MIEILRLLRPHQWTKNLLVFTSLLLAHEYGNVPLLLQTLLCFAVFCCVASGGYILNDWLDREDDRRHPDKCRRPLAAGEVSSSTALVLCIVLLLVGLGLAASINTGVLACAGAYLVATVLYSTWLKRKLLLDVVVLASLYTLRIIGGVAVMQVEPSFWLLAFAMFIFFSLANLKRFIELREANTNPGAASSSRAWRSEDAMMVVGLGLSTGIVAVLVLAFYINSSVVLDAYRYPPLLWLLCPLFLYWVGRIWLLANRSLVHGDPILFAVRDRLSYLVGLAALAIIVLAR